MMNSFYRNLGFLLAFLEEFEKKPGNDDAAIKDLEAKIRDFAFSAEDEVQSNLAKIYLEAADKEMILSQNLQQVGEDAEMMLFLNLLQVASKTQNFVNEIKREYNDSAVQDLTKGHSEIPVKKLVRLWIAEGFVEKSVRDKELEEVGVGYLQDLISRSLVQIDKLKCDGQIKTCRMHHLLRVLCVREARNEKLLYVEDDGFDMCNSSSKEACSGACRWLSFRSPKPENFDLCNSSVNKARSVLCLHNDEMPMVNDPKLVRFTLLRVLDLTSPLYNKGMYMSFENLSNLVLLEYLAFMSNRSLGFEGLDIALSKNQKLHTLVVWHSAAGWRPNYSLLPSTIWESPQLRHLEFRNCFRVEPPGIVKENLQSLYWLSIFHCTEEVISKIPNIKTLGIFCEGRLISDNAVSCNGASSLENLCHLNQLEALTIEAEYAIPKCISLPGINAFPGNLRELKLSKTYLPWKDIAAIAMLPGLEVLKLKMDAFYGPEWKPTEGGFQRLKFLLLINTDLKIWNAFDDEFPILEHLVLKHCENLEGIPTVFFNVTTLKSIDLERCGQALSSCAKNIQQEQLDYGNNELKVLVRNPQTTYKQLTFYKGRHRKVVGGSCDSDSDEEPSQDFGEWLKLIDG